MRKIACVLLAVWIAALPTPAAARVVEGVRFSPAVELENARLELAGAALLRWKVFVRAYVAALYLGAGARPEDVLGDVPKRIEIEYFHAIDAEAFARITRDRVRVNVSAAEYERLRPGVEALNRLYRDVAPGDRYALTYVPGTGTTLSKNGESLGTVPGADLGRALFAIWLGEEPVDAGLKQALLGQSA
jgi:hypothetical protein